MLHGKGKGLCLVRREITGVSLEVTLAGILQGFFLQRFSLYSVSLTKNKRKILNIKT